MTDTETAVIASDSLYHFSAFPTFPIIPIHRQVRPSANTGRLTIFVPNSDQLYLRMFLEMLCDDHRVVGDSVQSNRQSFYSSRQ